MKKVLFKVVSRCAKPFIGKGFTKNRVGKIIYKKFFPLIKPDCVYLEGNKYYIHDKNEISSDKLFYGEYEPAQTKIVKEVIKKGQTVADIGANIGYYTVIFSKLVGEKGKVYAFEPHPKNIILLKRNLEENKCENVRIEEKGISDKKGKTELYFNENHMGGPSLIDYQENAEKISIEIDKLDNLFKKQKIDFIKIDVEGVEFNVLKGASKLLDGKVNLIMEFNAKRLKEQGINPEKIIKFLKNKKFKLYAIEENKAYKDISQLIEVNEKNFDRLKTHDILGVK